MGSTALNEFNRGNTYYENQHYDSAIVVYEGLINKAYFSDDLHYNLANAYFKSNRLAKAILHYEKALKINPSNADAAYNLAIANEKTVDRIEAIPELFIYRWWKSIFNLFSADLWSKIALFFFVIALAGISLYWFLSAINIRKIGFFTAVIALFLALFSWFMAMQQNNYLNKLNFAIIIEPTVNIISSPSPGSSTLFVLHEGTKVKVKDEKGEWYNVSLPNGNEGWIKKSLVGEI